MWKEQLPANCPPSSALEKNMVAHRIIQHNRLIEEDFLPYVRKYPNNKRYKNLCKAYALSYYDSLTNAQIAIQESIIRGNKFGSYIAKIHLKEKDGKAEYNKINGHLSVWFYKNWELNDLELCSIVRIHEN